MKSKHLLLLFSQALIYTLYAAPNAGEQLILFVRTGETTIDSTFHESIPAIADIAKESGVEMTIVNVVKQGAPPEVSITPLIVYQNYRGRSIYQGRSNSLSRIRNFIRTSRHIPQGESLNIRKEIAVLKLGRTRVWSPIKIVPVTGSTPPRYNHKRFVREARKALEKGFDDFNILTEASLKRSDRGFYMDFYPWLSENGTVFLSLSLFSQFHCKKPVFELKETPLTGSWSKRRKLFRKAARIMEEAVRLQIQSPQYGDGFDTVGTEVAVASWEDLGLPLPEKPESASAVAIKDLTIPLHWELDSESTSDPPMVQLRFPAPLDNYTGTATKGTAEFHLGRNGVIDDASGFFGVDPKSVSMGESDLDDAIQGSLFLNTKKYPDARFKIDSITSESKNLSYGQLTPVDVTGIFTLKGIEIPLRPAMDLEPIVNNNGDPRLLIRSSFQINLRTFNIEEAEGPEPAKHTLLFDVYYVLKQKSN